AGNEGNQSRDRREQARARGAASTGAERTSVREHRSAAATKRSGRAAGRAIRFRLPPGEAGAHQAPSVAGSISQSASVSGPPNSFSTDLISATLRASFFDRSLSE